MVSAPGSNAGSYYLFNTADAVLFSAAIAESSYLKFALSEFNYLVLFHFPNESGKAMFVSI